MTKISTSILSINDNLIEKIIQLNNTNTDFIHYDIMDGQFVSNTSFSFEYIEKINNHIIKPLDIHLMVKNPKKYIEYYQKFNPRYITIHYEIEDYIKYIELIKKYNIKAGLSVKPKTNIEDIYKFLNKVDLVLIMSVEPGLGGQEFIEESIYKIKKLRKYIDDNNFNVVIEVDGGINNLTAPRCTEAGANILVSGSYITNSNNYQTSIDKLKCKS